MLTLGAMHSASNRCAEVDSARLRVVSMGWHHTFEFTPELFCGVFKHVYVE